MKQQDVALVVDDSPDTLGMLGEALEAAGIEVLMTLDGKQAIKIAQKIVPDVILLDAIMPHMDGFETCRQLKTNPALKDIPVIFMTGLSDTESIVLGLNAGGVDFLTKPINPDELVARLRVHLGNARRAHSVQQALDQTGQFLMGMSRQGKLTWATQQAEKLLETTGMDATQRQTRIFDPIGDWLTHEPKQGQLLHLRELEHPLDVQLVSDPGNDEDELVFKLIDPAAGPSPKILQENLPITERESEVLYWLAYGKTNKEIGEILELSPRTVNKHLEIIFRKLSVENRTAAAAVAIRLLNQS